jgi:hypothetical protein
MKYSYHSILLEEVNKCFLRQDSSVRVWQSYNSSPQAVVAVHQGSG